MRTAGLPVIGPPVQPGDFTVARRADHVIGAAEVRALLDGPAVILDVCEPAEYAGTEGHGERRLGHVPGARSLPWRDLLAADGTLLPEPLLARASRQWASGRTARWSPTVPAASVPAG